MLGLSLSNEADAMLLGRCVSRQAVAVKKGVKKDN